MTLRTVTYDDEQWQVVPKEATMYQVTAGAAHSSSGDLMVARGQAVAIYADMLAAAPEPPAQQQPMTVEQIVQSLRESILNLKACPESPATLGAISALEFQMGKIFHGIGKGDSNEG